MRLLPLSLMALLSAAPLAAQSDLPIHHRVLGNGLDVIVIENHAVPLVTIEMDVRNGSMTESPEFNGLSHLYEHMFFKANRTIPDQERYLQRLRQLGAIWNGTTSEERVNYFFTVGVDSLVPALAFMRDAVRFPLFQQAELERERPVVLNEFDRGEANPFFHLFRAVTRELYSPEFFSRKNVIGDRTIISTATQEKMRTIQQRYYVPNNSALLLSGDITPERGFQLAEQTFADWPRGADPFTTPVPDPPPLAESRAVIVEQPVNSVTLWLSWQGPSVRRDPASTYAADVLSAILNTETGRFHRRLVESGLAFGAGISYLTLDHAGPIRIGAQTTPDKVLALQRAILEEVDHFADSDYVTQAQLDAAHNQVMVEGITEREQPSSFASVLGFWWSVAGLDYYLTYRPRMQAVTRADLAAYARRYLVGRPRVTGVLISPEARARINLTTAALLGRETTP
jgi:zinc protease